MRGRPQGRRAIQNSHLSLEHAKTAPFRARDVRGGVPGAGVFRTPKSSAKLRAANLGPAGRGADPTSGEATVPPKSAIGNESTNGEADCRPQDASGASESTNGPTALRSNVAQSTSGQAAVCPESTIADANCANQEASFRSKASSDTGKSTNGEADLQRQGADGSTAGDTPGLPATQPKRRASDHPGNVLGR